MSLRGQQPETGTDLVLLHGWGMNSRIWTEFTERLGDFHLNLIDLPGHGGSPCPPPDASLTYWAQACLERAPENGTWVCWSLGAQVGLRAATLAPARIDSLVVIAGTPRFVQGPDWTPAMENTVFDGFARGLRDDAPSTLERFLFLQVRGSDRARDVLRQLRRFVLDQPLPHVEALAQGLDILANEDLRDELAEQPRPSLWLLGERDSLVPESLVPELKSISAHALIQVIPGAGHAPILSHPQACEEAIRKFIRETDDRG